MKYVSYLFVLLVLFACKVSNEVLEETANSPVASSPQPTSTSPPSNQRLIGRWQRSGSTHPEFADAASWGTAGYTKSRYEFKSDGSYIYTERLFRMQYQYILIFVENGRYQVNNNQITIDPRDSALKTYSKKNGTDELGNLIKTQQRALEKVTYRYTFHYFSGLGEWNLVLQADRPTIRDGSFSGNTTYSNAWYFDQKFVLNDLTSPKG